MTDDNLGLLLREKQPKINIKYTNHEGKTDWRVIIPLSIEFGTTEYYPEPQMLLVAFAYDRDDYRKFACKNILEMTRVVEVPEALDTTQVPGD